MAIFIGVKNLEYFMVDNQSHSQINPNQQTNPSTAENPFSKTALGVVLVLIETLLTLLLRADASLRQAAYPLVQDNTVLCIRSYVPHVTFYATFTVNGVLLDSELQPNQQVDVTINGFTWEVAQAIFTQKVSAVEKLQFRGDMTKVAQIKEFFLKIGVMAVVQELIAKFTGKKQDKTEEKPKKSVTEYQQKIEEQKQQLNALTVKNAEVQTALAEVKSQNKILKIAVGVLLVVVACLMVVVV